MKIFSSRETIHCNSFKPTTNIFQLLQIVLLAVTNTNKKSQQKLFSVLLHVFRCSTQVDDKGVHVGKIDAWGHCEMSIPACKGGAVSGGKADFLNKL